MPSSENHQEHLPQDESAVDKLNRTSWTRPPAQSSLCVNSLTASTGGGAFGGRLGDIDCVTCHSRIEQVDQRQCGAKCHALAISRCLLITFPTRGQFLKPQQSPFWQIFSLILSHHLFFRQRDFLLCQFDLRDLPKDGLEGPPLKIILELWLTW